MTRAIPSDEQARPHRVREMSGHDQPENREGPPLQEDGWNARALSAELAGRIESLCRELLPAGVKAGAEWRCGSVQGEAGKSLSVRLNGDKAGVWSDFATGDAGDALELVKATLGGSTSEAMGWARSWLGLPTGPAAKRRPRRPADQRGLEAPGFSDDALALQFTEAHKDRLRYVAKWNRWLRWDGIRWNVDETIEVYDQVRAVCREAASRAEKGKIRIASAKTVAAVENLAKADRRHAATVDQWDADPMLLNTPDGVIDLTTGDLRGHRAENYMTKTTPVGPSGSCPVFLTFLRDVTDGREDLERYLQRVVGYCLTGSTSEHAFFYLYGTGANGKSTFIDAIAGILGGYHVTAPMEVLLHSKNDRHPTELAMLRGARCVSAVETEQGRYWAEARIKALTGGDRITARFMRQDFFTFDPQCKFLIAGNHKPSLRTVDEAMRRRLHLIPFDVTIPRERRDRTLPARLHEELEGILEWAVEGCLEWQERGLDPPQCVRDATTDYLDQADNLKAWIDEQCVPCDVVQSTALLLTRFNEYCKRLDEPQWKRGDFTDRLRALGYKPGRTGKFRGFKGLRPALTYEHDEGR